MTSAGLRITTQGTTPTLRVTPCLFRRSTRAQNVPASWPEKNHRWHPPDRYRDKLRRSHAWRSNHDRKRQFLARSRDLLDTSPALAPCAPCCEIAPRAHTACLQVKFVSPIGDRGSVSFLPEREEGATAGSKGSQGNDKLGVHACVKQIDTNDIVHLAALPAAWDSPKFVQKEPARSAAKGVVSGDGLLEIRVCSVVTSRQ